MAWPGYLSDLDLGGGSPIRPGLRSPGQQVARWPDHRGPFAGVRTATDTDMWTCGAGDSGPGWQVAGPPGHRELDIGVGSSCPVLDGSAGLGAWMTVPLADHVGGLSLLPSLACRPYRNEAAAVGKDLDRGVLQGIWRAPAARGRHSYTSVLGIVMFGGPHFFPLVENV